MQRFNTSFPSRRPEVESWHAGRGVNDTFLNLLKVLLLVFFHSWNSMQPSLFLCTSADLRSSLLRYYISFLKCLQTNPKSYHHRLVSWFVVLFQRVVVWIQKCFSGHLAWLSVLHPNWVEFVAPLFWCETWPMQQSFAVSSGAHVVFWLEGISLIKLILYSCKHTKLLQLLPINYQFVCLPITIVLVCKWYRLCSFLPCASLPTAVPRSSASTPALCR